MTVHSARAPASALEQVIARLPAAAVLCGAEVGAGYAQDASTIAGVRPDLVLRPATTDEVSAILAACHADGRRVVVQGGRTGLAGGASPQPGEVALSLERMNAVGRVDPLSASITVGAGVPLARVQQAAEAAGMRFPVDLGARGTATIGGMVATNAGGIRVLRYGMMRAQVLDLRAVLADGTAIGGAGVLQKDNSGYDLTQLMIGTEGTLGVVTEVTLALKPAPQVVTMAFGQVADVAAAQRLLVALRAGLGQHLSACELILGRVYDAAIARGPKPPVPTGGAAYVIVEAEGGDASVHDMLEAVLAPALEDGTLLDAAVARSGREQAAIWDIRDGCSEVIFARSDMWGHDIGIAPERLADFLREAEAAIARNEPDATCWVFGHLGDGNLHFIVQTRKHAETARIVYEAVGRAGGALSAEHGIGREKVDYLHYVRSPAEIATMRRLKAALDPRGALNPGRVLPKETEEIR